MGGGEFPISGYPGVGLVEQQEPSTCFQTLAQTQAQNKKSLFYSLMKLAQTVGGYLRQMRTIKYKTHWSYLAPPVKHEESLADFILDILYFMEETGIIPPLLVLNKVLRGGGDDGGMGPGTTWRPFTISDAEYQELVNALLQLDVEEARQKHPYIRFKKIKVDQELNDCTDYIDWLRRATSKYGKE